MATNTFNNVAYIAKSAMKVLRNNLVLIPRVNRTHEECFDGANGKIGDTVNARIPGYGTVTDGKVAVPSGYNDSYIPITVAQKNASLKFSSKELALNVEEGDEFERSVLGPQLAALTNRMEADGFALYSQIPYFQGVPGTAPTDLSAFLNAQAQLADGAAPVDDQIYAYLNPWSQASMVNGLKGLFADTSEIAAQYKKGVMGTAAGMKFMMSQNVKTHTTGVIASSTPLVNGTTAEGATTLVTDGWNSGASQLKAGDIFTVASVNAANPVSKADTGQLQQFRVTATISDTAGAMTIAFSPAMIASTSNPLQNITALPANDAAIKVFGTVATLGGKVSPTNLVLHRDCLGFACKDLPQTTSRDLQSRQRDKDLGVSVRVTKYYDGTTDDLLYRLDVLYGWAVLRPGFGCRVQG